MLLPYSKFVPEDVVRGNHVCVTCLPDCISIVPTIRQRYVSNSTIYLDEICKDHNNGKYQAVQYLHLCCDELKWSKKDKQGLQVNKNLSYINIFARVFLPDLLSNQNPALFLYLTRILLVCEEFRHELQLFQSLKFHTLKMPPASDGIGVLWIGWS